MKLRQKIVTALLENIKYFGRVGRYIGVSIKYFHVRRRLPNLLRPKDISEYILASLCRPQFLKYADYADKVKVRDYVKSKGLDNILLDHYAVYESVNDINLDKLPDKFILKPNNGSGGHVYCRNKAEFDLNSAKEILQDNLKRATEYFLEPHYLKIHPCVFAEQLLDLGVGQVLTDYKFTCINGDIVDIFIAGENTKGERKYATLDTSWNMLPFTKQEYQMEEIPCKPSNLEAMIKYAKILSKDFNFVRVDFYEHDNKVYFSELTFSPWGGYMYSYTDKAIKLLGDKLK